MCYEYKYSSTPDKTLDNISLPNKINQKFHYDKLGRLDKISLINNKANTLTKKFSYLKNGDHTSNLISAITFASDTIFDSDLIVNLTMDKYTYKYDIKCNITEIRYNNDLVARYSYNSLSRIIRENNKELEKTIIFSFYTGGNITQKKEYCYILVDNLNYDSKKEFNFTYPISGWKDQIFKYNNELFKYDNLGNPTLYRNKELKWSHTRHI